MMGSRVNTTEGAGSRGREESTDMVDTCDIGSARPSTIDLVAALVIVRRLSYSCGKGVLYQLTGISRAALEECARSGDQPWADRVIAKAFTPSSSFISSLQRINCWQAQNS